MHPRRCLAQEIFMGERDSNPQSSRTTDVTRAQCTGKIISPAIALTPTVAHGQDCHEGLPDIIIKARVCGFGRYRPHRASRRMPAFRG